jgi:hypothetical protein
VGSAILGFINEKRGDVNFNDILRVYSEERTRIGKIASPEIELRNCRSTIYMMVRDGKLREVQKNKVYSSI